MTYTTQRPIGILGGTFDPIHFGHLRAALELYQQLQLAEVRLLPCKKPVHKAMSFSGPQHRQAMVQRAITPEPGLTLDARELQRNTPSYMIETLQSLREEIGQQPLCLIMGFDALQSLHRWHRWQELIQYAHIIGVQRPAFAFDWSSKPVADLLEPRLVEHFEMLHQQPAGNLLLTTTTLLGISGTEIRRLIQNHLSPRYLLPEPVYDYIQRHQLYRTSRPSH